MLLGGPGRAVFSSARGKGSSLRPPPDRGIRTRSSNRAARTTGGTCRGDLAVAHVHAGEDGVVERVRGRCRRRGVGPGAVGGEAHRGLQDLLPFGEVRVDPGEAPFGTADVGGDAGLTRTAQTTSATSSSPRSRRCPGSTSSDSTATAVTSRSRSTTRRRSTLPTRLNGNRGNPIARASIRPRGVHEGRARARSTTKGRRGRPVPPRPAPTGRRLRSMVGRGFTGAHGRGLRSMVGRGCTGAHGRGLRSMVGVKG
jgi:hypothetical protein